MTPFCSSSRGGDQDRSAVNGEEGNAVKFCGGPVGTVVWVQYNYFNLSNNTYEATIALLRTHNHGQSHTHAHTGKSLYTYVKSHHLHQ